MRLTPEEMRKLKELAAADGLNASGYLRQFIVRTHREQQAATPKKRPPKA